MKIVLEKLKADGQGSFFVRDKVSDENYFHFLTQIENKVALEKTLQKYLDETRVKKEAETLIEKDIATIIAKLI